MPIKRKDFERVFVNFTRDQIDMLVRHKDMLISFYAETDWAFLIKSHALIEAVVTESLVKAIGETRLRKLVSRMPLGGEIGKMKMAKEMGILTEKQEACIACLSAIRNQLVHKVENVNFDLKQHISLIDNPGKNRLFCALVWQDMDAALKVKWRQHFDLCPRFVVLTFLLPLLSVVALKSAHRAGERALSELALATADEIFDALFNDV